jgi:GR25 family glycosyltransferase involved in LPS biosynthesis
MNLNPVVIHLENATERKPIISLMELVLRAPIRVHKASNGRGPVLPHVQSGSQVTRGAIGCYESHIEVLTEFAESGDEYRLILEDDTIFLCDIAQIHKMIEESNTLANWDMIYISYSNVVSTTPLHSKSLCKINGCYGTYAMLLRRSALPKLKAALSYIEASRTFYPADWVYKLAIERYGLIALGPIQKDAFAWYKSGYSYVSNIIRS